MAENNTSKNEDKPFSVLERYRQLKKDQEQPTKQDFPEEKATSSSSTGTIFQASTSSLKSHNGDFSGGRGLGKSVLS